jgi:hypothetical protein
MDAVPGTPNLSGRNAVSGVPILCLLAAALSTLPSKSHVKKSLRLLAGYGFFRGVKPAEG